MSEVYKYYLQLVDKVRKILNEDFSDGMEQKPRTEGFLPDKKKEVLKKHSDSIREETLKELAKLKTEISKWKENTISERRGALYPGLYYSSMDKSEKQNALAEQNNAMLLFQSSWQMNDLETLINSIKSGIETGQNILVSTLLDKIRNSAATNEIQKLIKDEAGKLEPEYFKKIGIDVYDEKIRILNYAGNSAEASGKLIERSEMTGDERYYLPEYPVKEFQDKMTIADIELKTGVSFNLEDSGPSWAMEASASEGSSGAGSAAAQ